jgi:aminoglycoside phosphotransferase (APT) family kinase protein
VPKREPHDPFTDEHEPLLEGDDWVEWGGERIWAAGLTPGGAPYGIGADEWRRTLRSEGSNAGWIRARDVLQELVRLQCAPNCRIDLGRVVKIGTGLSRDVFAAEVTVDPDDDRLSGDYAVLLPRRDAVPGLDARVGTELRVLRALRGSALPFRFPGPLGALPDRYGLALTRELVSGIPLDLRAGRMGSLRPWQVVAGVAAAIHSFAPLTAIDPSWARETRRDHALAAIAVLDEIDGHDAAQASAWAHEHLPPAEPATLVHGDLLGQNLLIDPTVSPAIGVIDWEYACAGDPAYDLAIVTRGVRRPFQIERGLERLLDAYETAIAGRVQLRMDHVRVHELALAGRWYKDALEGRGEANEPKEQALARLRRVLQLATSSSRTRS